MSDTNGDMLKAALEYHRRGWCIIPIRPGTKRAAYKWARYQTQRPSEAELREWFGGSGGFGIAAVLGEVSGRLVCRDFDQVEAYEAWAEKFPELAQALPTARTYRGYHVYCRAAELAHTNLPDGEYRGRGHYAILPPSEDSKGGAYAWQVQPNGEVPLVGDPVAAGLLPPKPPATAGRGRGDGGFAEPTPGRPAAPTSEGHRNAGRPAACTNACTKSGASEHTAGNRWQDGEADLARESLAGGDGSPCECATKTPAVIL